MDNLNARATEAATRFLIRQGYSVLDTNWSCPAGTASIVAESDSAIAFIDVNARGSAAKGFPPECRTEEERTQRENIAIAWLAKHEEAIDIPIRFDNIALLVLESSRALIRHHLGVFNGAPAESQPDVADIIDRLAQPVLSEAA